MVKFTKASGGESASKIEQYKYKDGEQSVRIFGDILSRYLFWVPNPKGNPANLPVEAMQFQRDTESWDNSVEEPVKEELPDLKPKWSYSVLCIDSDNNITALPFKRTLWNQIKDAAETLGDPTDLKDGWDLVFKRTKTGPSPLNVEYTLSQLKCQNKKGPVSDEALELIKEHKTLDEIYPRPTVEEARKNLANILSSGNDEEVDEDAIEQASEEIDIQ